MSTLERLWTSPTRLQWWEWGKILGAAGLLGLGASVVASYVPPPVLVAVLVHVAVDFTFQSAETVARKGERGRHLLVHGAIAGGLPLALAKLAAGDLPAVLISSVIAAACHVAVDGTRKFGLRSLPLAVGLDQACHLAVILALALGGGGL
jgi:hypothetical protein